MRFSRLPLLWPGDDPRLHRFVEVLDLAFGLLVMLAANLLLRHTLRSIHRLASSRRCGGLAG
jgi:hypothetical protein